MVLYLILILRESENHLYFRFRDMLEHLVPQDFLEKLVHEYVIEKMVSIITRLNLQLYHFHSQQNSKLDKILNFVLLNIGRPYLYLVKVLLKRFHLNGHTAGFDPYAQKLELQTK